jgi:octaprenyl-diphosphate synthase
MIPQYRPCEDLLAPLVSLGLKDMRSVDQCLHDCLKDSIPMIPQIGGYIIQGGGKRFRPLLTIASARLCGYQGEDHIPLAASVELIHTATLLHDDVIDESMTRRSQATANARWGNVASVLVGDFLFSRSFQLMVQSKNLKVLEVLSQASSTIVEGEIGQLTLQGNLHMNLDDYFQMIYGKTAALFQAACEVGALIAGQEKYQEILGFYGRYVGMAFQIRDDWMDYFSSEELMGKIPGADFREGKVTLPVLWSYQNATAAEKIFWERTLGEGRQEGADFNDAIEILRKHQASEKMRSYAVKYIEKAIEKISIFSPCPWKEALVQGAWASLDRWN